MVGVECYGLLCWMVVGFYVVEVLVYVLFEVVELVVIDEFDECF